MTADPPSGGQYPQYPEGVGYQAPADYPGSAGYGQGYGAPAAPRNGLGTTALVLGIIAVVTCWTVVGGILLGALGLIFGLIGRGRANRNEATNGGVATAGAITGVVGLVLAIVLLVVFIVVGAAFFRFSVGTAKNYADCVQRAQTVQEQQQCAVEFSQNVAPTR